ncbi:hypothetical protein [Citromicrobium sp. JLT1363]|uniref:hypothetical protein n=1 Tax=Citromicrobium sp. JLT1363 TaxID=517722 RepID=UPI000225E803|nr:hypothetical protein [Citromicrobium sp. JLT1363]
MTARVRPGGRPLIAVLALLSGWIAIRASVWEPPFPLPAADALFAQAQATGETSYRTRDGAQARAKMGAGPLRPQRLELPAMALAMRRPHIVGARAGGFPTSGAAYAYPAGMQLARLRQYASHQLLFAAALSSLPTYGAMPEGRLARDRKGRPGRGQRPAALGWQAIGLALQTPPGTGPVKPARKPDRWAVDAWLLIREGSGPGRLAGTGPASYGQDQAGAVVRYALAPGSALQPKAYARASKALVRGGETEIAAGASIALVQDPPLTIHGEARLTDRPGVAGDRTELRPAVFVVTGFPRKELAGGLEADAYVQAGYVGGDFETGFVDGKASLEAPVLRSDAGNVTLGAGVWGGAQRDVSRLDVGPTASATVATGKATLRASVGYRFRIAGDANPGDGPALTLAASF